VVPAELLKVAEAEMNTIRSFKLIHLFMIKSNSKNCSPNHKPIFIQLAFDELVTYSCLLFEFA
jgi:hypothetical protein